MGRSDHGWLRSSHHFSFADYYDPHRMGCGVLRVVNDDLVMPHTGFDSHPHADMEIVSYVVNGALTHTDSMGHRHTLTRGQVQYMSAGTGVYHSEYNHGESPLRFLQIWIIPDQTGYPPQYGDCAYPWQAREGKWLPIASGREGGAPVRLHQDIEVAVVSLADSETIEWPAGQNRQQYLVLIEGRGTLNQQAMDAQDAAQVQGETIRLTAEGDAHCLLFDMAAH